MRSARPSSKRPVEECSAFSIALAILALSNGTLVPSRFITCNMTVYPLVIVTSLLVELDVLRKKHWVILPSKSTQSPYHTVMTP